MPKAALEAEIFRKHAQGAPAAFSFSSDFAQTFAFTRKKKIKGAGARSAPAPRQKRGGILGEARFGPFGPWALGSFLEGLDKTFRRAQASMSRRDKSSEEGTSETPSFVQLVIVFEFSRSRTSCGGLGSVRHRVCDYLGPFLTVVPRMGNHTNIRYSLAG